MPSFSFLRASVLVAALLATLSTGIPIEERAVDVTGCAASTKYTPRPTSTKSTITPTPTPTQPKPSATSTSSAAGAAPTGAIWQPKAGTPFQIVLHGAITDFSYNAPVYIIDMVENSAATIEKLHSLNRKVICYFSAGSYENWRPDANKFAKSDYGKALDGWAGENWLNTKSTNVRAIMTERIKLAKSKGCDGVDPDNVDGYSNDTGFNMKQSDGVDYMRFLAGEAHKLGLSIGLKNAPDIAKSVLDVMQWEVNEQCLEFGECSDFKLFIDAGKPVFQIEVSDLGPAACRV